MKKGVIFRILDPSINFGGRNLGVVVTADQFITAAGITNPTVIAAVKAYFDGLHDYGLWDKKEVIYLYAATATADGQKLNFIAPQDTDEAYRQVFVNDAPGAHTSQGFKPNVTSGIYADSKYKITNAGDFHMSAYNLTAELTNTTLTGFCGAQSDKVYMSRNFSQRTMCVIGGGTAAAVQADIAYNRAKLGYLLANRSGNSVKLYDDGVEIASGTEASTVGVHTTGMAIGAISPSASASLQAYTRTTLGIFTIGKALTPTEVTNDNTLVVDFLEALGLI